MAHPPGCDTCGHCVDFLLEFPLLPPPEASHPLPLTPMDTPPKQSTFNVIFLGFRPDVDAHDARAKISALFKITPEQGVQLFASFPCVVKKSLPAPMAAKYQRAIESTGGLCRIDPEFQALAAAPNPGPDLAALPTAQHPSGKLLLSNAPSPVLAAQAPTSKRPWSHALTQVRSKVRQFLGKDGVDRSLHLNFSLPAPSKRVSIGSSRTAELRHCKEEPSAYFQLLYSRIKYLNYCRLSPGKRRRITFELLELFYPMAMAQIVEHAKTGGVPEPTERRSALVALIDVAKILIMSCQFLLDDLYSGGDFRFARNRTSRRECASHIFELLLLKQRAQALRYQRLDESDWKLANTLFFVMRACDDVEAPLSTLNAKFGLDTDLLTVNFRNQFLLLQIFAWFDPLRWPTHIQWVIDSYVRRVRDGVLLHDDSGPLQAHALVVYCYGKQAAMEQRLNAPPGPALVLDLKNLVTAMQEDCVGLTQSKKHGQALQVMKRFERFEVNDHFRIRDRLFHRLHPTAPDEGVRLDQAVEGLRIFVGFHEVSSLLLHRQGDFGQEERLADVLAKRSAILAQDHTSLHKTTWSLVFQNQHTLRLSTQESRATVAMAVGSLLAFGVGDEVNRPRFGVVSRIHRPLSKVVEIDIALIADFAEAVVITLNAPVSKTQFLALLVHHSQTPGEWAVMWPPRDVMIGVDQVEIHRKNRALPVELTQLRNATHQFYLVDTTLTSAALGFSRPPVYPELLARWQSGLA